jgi:hypothetical protein
MSRIGGKNFDVNLGDLQVHVESCTLDITDNTAVAQPGAYPTGTSTATWRAAVNSSWTPTSTC